MAQPQSMAAATALAVDISRRYRFRGYTCRSVYTWLITTRSPSTLTDSEVVSSRSSRSSGSNRSLSNERFSNSQASTMRPTLSWL